MVTVMDVDTVAQEEFVYLPATYESWPNLRADLKALASKERKGIGALEEVLERNDRWGGARPPMSLLRHVLKEGKVVSGEHFCEILLPWLAKKALQVEDLFSNSEYKIKNLYTGREDEVVLTRQQICCLLSLAFFNAFEIQQGNYQRLTFCSFVFPPMSQFNRSQKGKLLCLLHYFDRIQCSEEAGERDFLELHVAVTRRRVKLGAPWEECNEQLLPFESLSDGMIETADGCLQVDFANAYIGGGVLGFGQVQEEIRFVINPECLVSLLFCEEMDELESILIAGAEQFSSYSGYGGTFAYAGPHEDKNPADEHKKRCVSIIAIDATPFMDNSFDRIFQEPPHEDVQFQKKSILRELNKAYSGFTCRIAGDDLSAGKMAPVATGNWGCGAFGGNRQLKCIIQWLAASRAGRAVKYYTFRDKQFSHEQAKIIELCLAGEVTIGKLYELLVSNKERAVFQFIESKMADLTIAD